MGEEKFAVFFIIFLDYKAISLPIFYFEFCGFGLNVDGKTLSVSEISAKPVEVGADMDGYLLYLGGFSEGDWLYEVKADGALPDGTYKAEIVTESVSPMSFILN